MVKRDGHVDQRDALGGLKMSWDAVRVTSFCIFLTIFWSSIDHPFTISDSELTRDHLWGILSKIAWGSSQPPGCPLRASCAIFAHPELAPRGEPQRRRRAWASSWMGIFGHLCLALCNKLPLDGLL